MNHWTPINLVSLCQPLGIAGQLPEHLGALQTDSRKIQAGDVFIAVKDRIRMGIPIYLRPSRREPAW